MGRIVSRGPLLHILPSPTLTVTVMQNLRPSHSASRVPLTYGPDRHSSPPFERNIVTNCPSPPGSEQQGFGERPRTSGYKWEATQLFRLSIMHRAPSRVEGETERDGEVRCAAAIVGACTTLWGPLSGWGDSPYAGGRFHDTTGRTGSPTPTESLTGESNPPRFVLRAWAVSSVSLAPVST